MAKAVHAFASKFYQEKCWIRCTLLDYNRVTWIIFITWRINTQASSINIQNVRRFARVQRYLQRSLIIDNYKTKPRMQFFNSWFSSYFGFENHPLNFLIPVVEHPVYLYNAFENTHASVNLSKRKSVTMFRLEKWKNGKKRYAAYKKNQSPRSGQ